MGTHPIFESDFDCLTGYSMNRAVRDFRGTKDYDPNKLQRPRVECLWKPKEFRTPEDERKIMEQEKRSAAWRKQEGIELRFAEEAHLWVKIDQQTESEEAKRKKAGIKASNIAAQEARSHPKVQGPSIGRGQMLNRKPQEIGVPLKPPSPVSEPAQKQEPWTLDNHVPQGAVKKEDEPARAAGRGRGRGRGRIIQ